MSDAIQAFWDALFSGQGWAVAVAFILGILSILLINFVVEQIRRIQQWFLPIQVPGPPPTRPSPSGCARFMSCLWAGVWLLVIFGGVAAFILWLLAEGNILDGLVDSVQSLASLR